MQIEVVEQGTEAWHAQRLGNITGSRVVDIMPGPKGYRQSRANSIADIITERLTGTPRASFTNQAMQWGTDTEPLARAAYEVLTGRMVEEVGYLAHPEIEHFGGSPDGLVGSDGMIEIKCPNSATHLATIITGKIRIDYHYQMQAYMLITGRAWCDFVSYDPRFDDRRSIFVKRIHAEKTAAESIVSEVKKVLAEIDEKMAAIADYSPEVTK